jgi:hypothetical protein
VARSSRVQTNFLGGEWNPQAQGRSDDPAYETALNTCLNHQPIEEGSLPRRSGLAFFGYTCGTNGARGAYSRLLPFVSDDTAGSYVLELSVPGGVGHLRIINGSNLVMDDDSDSPQVTTAATTNNPAVFTIPSTSAFSVHDNCEFWFPANYAAADMAGYNAEILIVNTVPSSTTITLHDPNNQPVAFLNGTSNLIGAALRRVTNLSTVYTTTAQLKALRCIQHEQTAFLVTSGVAPQTVSQCPHFSIAQTAFVDGPYQDPLQATGTISGYSGAITFTAGSAQFAATDTSGSGGTGTFNRHIRIFTEPAAWASGTTYAQNAYVKYNNGYWQSNIASNVGYNPGTSPVINNVATAAWIPVPPRGVAQWGWGTITAYTSSTVVTVTLVQPLLSANGTSVTTGNWQLGLYSDTTGYPTCGVHHEGRLWLAGAVGNRFDGSTVDDPTLTIGSGVLCFSPTDIDGTVPDSCSIDYTVDATDISQILWMLPEQQGIMFGTAGGEWLVAASNSSDALTPTDIQAHRITRWRCANMLPVQAGMATVFVQAQQIKIIEYLADAISGRFSGRPLNDKAKHMFEGLGISEIAYQEEPTPTLWARCSDGSLYGCVYRRVSRFVSEAPVFNGWHRVQFGNGYTGNASRIVQSMAVVPANGGLTDRLYVVTTDVYGNNGSLCFLKEPAAASDVLGNAWLLDESLVNGNLAENTCTARTGDNYTNSPPHSGTTTTTVDLTSTPPYNNNTYNPGPPPPPAGQKQVIIGAPFVGVKWGAALNTVEAVYFDGATSLYNLPSAAADTTSMLLSFWTRAGDIGCAGNGGYLYSIISNQAETVFGNAGGTNTGLGFYNPMEAYVDTGLALTWTGLGASTTESTEFINVINGDSAPFWTHVMMSWHLSGGKILVSVCLNDTMVVTEQAVVNSSWSIQKGHDHGSNYSQIGGFLGGGGAGSLPDNVTFPGFQGAIQELWIGHGQWQDISVQANRNLWHKTDDFGQSFKPVGLKADGSGPTGTKPLIYCTGNTQQFPINRAKGTLLTVHGQLLPVPDWPPPKL